MLNRRTHHHEGGTPRRLRTALRALAGLAAVAATVAGPVTTTHAAGPSWIPLGTSVSSSGGGTSGVVYASLVVGGLTYIGGGFDAADGVAVNNVAVWDGTSFHALGDPATDGPTDWVFSLATDGTLIYAGGPFGVMSYDPGTQTWTDLTVPSGTEAYALQWYSDGTSSYLVMGGDILGGDCQLLRYDGSGSWTSIAPITTGLIRSCTVWALGQYGNQLVVAGEFQQINGDPYNSVGLWDGATDTWSHLDGTSGDGVLWGSDPGAVYVVLVDDSTSTIYLGGQFDSAGGTTTTNLTAWNSGAFTELGGSSVQWDVNNEEVDALSFGNGQIAVGGLFAIDGTQLNVAVLDLASDQWTPLLGGVDDLVTTIAVNYTLLQAYIGGEFGTAYADDTQTPIPNTNAIVMFGDSTVSPQITAISVTGTATVGQTLTAHVTATGDPTPTVTLQWIRCDAWTGLNTPTVDRAPVIERLLPDGCAEIAGATATTYTLVAADAGKHIGVIAVADNGAGSALNLAVQQPAVAAPSTPTTPTTTINPTLPATGSSGSLPLTAVLLVATGLVLLVPVRRRWLR